MNRGFTLIELLVVVLVIGILSAVALPQYQTAVERARATEALAQMSALQGALERYHSQRESWPANFNQLDTDFPTIPNSSPVAYGGKHFTLTFSGTNKSGSTPATATITAERRRDNDTYTLATIITEQNNGTYSSKRTCTAGVGDHAAAYCNAISGGHNGLTDEDPGF